MENQKAKYDVRGTMTVHGFKPETKNQKLKGKK
jgi:hypothetical protein